jgi:hypothetical protein
VTSCLPLAVCAPPDSSQCQRLHPIKSTRCLPSQSDPSPLVHSRLSGSIASPLFLECAVRPLLRCTHLHVYLVSPPRGQQCFHRHPLGTCELASLQVVHPSASACLAGSCIRMSHARSIGESLSPSLGSDGRASGWALRLRRLLP